MARRHQADPLHTTASQARCRSARPLNNAPARSRHTPHCAASRPWLPPPDPWPRPSHITRRTSDARGRADAGLMRLVGRKELLGFALQGTCQITQALKLQNFKIRAC